MSTPHACPADRHHHRRHQHRRIRPQSRFDRPSAAIGVIDRTVHDPRRNETIALLLDHERRGIAIVSVTSTDDLDDVVEVVELLTLPTTHEGRADAIVVASVWRGRPPGRVGRSILDRWLELDQIAADHGVELLDWFEFADRVTSLRVEAGAPSRW